MLDPINNPFPIEDTSFRDEKPGLTPEQQKQLQSKRERGESLERQERLERNQMADVLATPSGQAVIMRLLCFCEPLRPIQMGEHAQAAVLEGRRRVGLWIIDQMQKVDPDLYSRMISAHLKRLRDSFNYEAAVSAPH